MKLLLEDLEREAAATGFLAETLEKALRLLSLLDALRSHPFLRGRIALKGGTALNLFVFDVPRLSVDIDLNYIGSLDREIMLAERPKIDQAVQSVCGREALAVKRVPGEHAGGKWRLTYAAASGRSGNLELDVNFLLRTPLWPAAVTDSRRVGSHQATQVSMLDVHELAAGKLAALLSRTASRDVFDARELLRRDDIDATKLRLGFVVYGGANPKDWRTVSVDDVKIDLTELRSQLLPTLRTATVPGPKELAAWGAELVSECRNLLAVVLPLTASEREFIERLNDRGEIAPELLTADAAMEAALREHPALRWKALNVKKHRGGTGDDHTD
ncbi:MAG: nucleotidyl transferase AbiEii/AbiGii toxin family protein [Myxococcaceae bacterium]